jgi:uncharacterized lipoprotein YajG
MQRFFLLLLCALTAASMTGCAYIRQKATLRLDPHIAPSTIGNGIPVAVRVVDLRRSNVIGHRGVDSENARITTDQNVTALFLDKIVEGLRAKGFVAAPFDGQSGRLLTVEIRRIEYSNDMDFWKGVFTTDAELTASTFKDGVKFEQLYAGRRKETSVEAPGAATNERLINGAISDALQRLFADERLMRYLAE